MDEQFTLGLKFIRLVDPRHFGTRSVGCKSRATLVALFVGMMDKGLKPYIYAGMQSLALPPSTEVDNGAIPLVGSKEEHRRNN